MRYLAKEHEGVVDGNEIENSFNCQDDRTVIFSHPSCFILGG